MIRVFQVLALVLLTSCGRSPAPPRDAATSSAERAAGSPPAVEDPAQPSARVAAAVLRKYFALLSANQRDAASQLWTPAGRSTMQAFEAQLPDQAIGDVRVGEPAQIEGAAGSLYVTIPVEILGKRSTGEAVRLVGTATLRRSNNVPGSTPEQLSWRIAGIELKSPSSEGRGPG